MDWFLEQPPRPARARRSCAPSPARRHASPAVDRRSRERLPRVLRMHARRERVPLAATASAPSPVPPGPARIALDDRRRRSYRVDYEPGESTTGLFGGNSNWRGPVWFPVNYLLIEALQQLPPLLRRRLQGRVPDRLRRRMMTLGEVAAELVAAPDRLFLRDATGRRPVPGGDRAVPDRPALARPASSSTSTSTATPARASAPATRPAGPAWSPS